MFKTTACSFYFPSFSAVTVKLKAAGKTKRSETNGLVFWSIKFGFSSFSNLSSSAVAGQLDKSAKDKNTQRMARKRGHIKNFRFIRTSDLSTPRPTTNRLRFCTDWLNFIGTGVSGKPQSWHSPRPSESPPGQTRRCVLETKQASRDGNSKTPLLRTRFP